MRSFSVFHGGSDGMRCVHVMRFARRHASQMFSSFTQSKTSRPVSGNRSSNRDAKKPPASAGDEMAHTARRACDSIGKIVWKYSSGSMNAASSRMTMSGCRPRPPTTLCAWERSTVAVGLGMRLFACRETYITFADFVAIWMPPGSLARHAYVWFITQVD